MQRHHDTRIRRHEGVPCLQIKVRDTWQVLFGNGTYGNMDAIKEWLHDTKPKYAAAIITEFERHEFAQTSIERFPKILGRLHDSEKEEVA